jgi:hypothetical protein
MWRSRRVKCLQTVAEMQLLAGKGSEALESLALLLASDGLTDEERAAALSSQASATTTKQKQTKNFTQESTFRV